MENNLGNKEIMAKNITRFMQAKGVNRADFSRDLGFNYSTVSDWIHAKKYPRAIVSSDYITQKPLSRSRLRGFRVQKNERHLMKNIYAPSYDFIIGKNR